MFKTLWEQVVLYSTHHREVPQIGQWAVVQENSGLWHQGVVTEIRGEQVLVLFSHTKNAVKELLINHCVFWVENNVRRQDWRFALLSYLPLWMLRNNQHLYAHAAEHLDEAYLWAAVYQTPFEVVQLVLKYVAGDSEMAQIIFCRKLKTIESVEAFVQEATGKRGCDYELPHLAAQALKTAFFERSELVEETV